MTAPQTLGRSLTIDRRRHTALARDLVLQKLASSRGRGRLTLGAVGGFVVALVASAGAWPLALGAALVGSVAVAAVWWGHADAVLAAPGILALLRTRRGLRATYVVGRMIRAAVTPERLLFSTPLGTRPLRWSDVDGQRVTPDAVLLRRRRAALTATRTEVLPRALFTDEALAELSGAVPRRF